jgi:glycolate oxidase iron-sulfur subunit
MSAMDETSKGTATLYDDLELVRGELSKCMKCGNCMAVCPVYLTDKTEAGVARGKIAVAEAVLSGELDIDDPEVVHMLFNCLVCKSCMQNCPTKVNFDRIMLALRAAVVRKKGLHPLKEMIFGMLKQPKLFDAAMKVGAALQGIAFRDNPDQKAISPRSPFAFVGKNYGFDSRRSLPELAVIPFRDRFPSLTEIKGAATKVAFFTGCSVNYFYPEVGEDLVTVFMENKVSVAIPKEQQCCGIAVFVHGDLKTVRELARKNIDAIEKSGADYIVTACGSCGGAWQHEYKELLSKDAVYGPKALYWSGRTYDISTFLTRVINYRRPKGKVDAVVTYHDSCHLKKTMKVSQEPRQILMDIPGIAFREMSKPDACCGSGGSYLLTHYETSKNIAKRKVADINQTQADYVTTGCPACMMQLLDHVGRFGNGQKIKHYISLLAESYRKEKQGAVPDVR